MLKIHIFGYFSYLIPIQRQALRKKGISMSWLGQLSAFFTTLAQLPAAALLVAVIAVLFLFCSFGIGIGMALRDIPKYIAQIIFFILNFILILCRKDPMSIPPDNQKENFDPTKDLKIIQGGKKSEKKEKKEESCEDDQAK